MSDLVAALELVSSERCMCRVREVRHQTLLALLQLLSERGAVAWDEVLRRAEASALAFNRMHDLPLSSRPASGSYKADALDIGWFQGYIADGNTRDGRRYSEDGAHIRTEVFFGPGGEGLRLVRSSASTELRATLNSAAPSAAPPASSSGRAAVSRPQTRNGADDERFDADPETRLLAAMEAPSAASTSHPPRLDELPPDLVDGAGELGREVFGAINAWLLFVGPSPGGSPGNPEAVRQFADDYIPVLGRPHPHFEYPDSAGFWRTVRAWGCEAFRRGAALTSERDALSLLMVMNLLDQQTADSAALSHLLPTGAPRFKSVLHVVQPRVVVALTGDVQDSLLGALPSGARVLRRDVHSVGRYHPESAWIELTDGWQFLVARAPNHPSRQYPRPETYAYLGTLVSVGLRGPGNAT